jgi:YVTN family beta-propeller protein
VLTTVAVGNWPFGLAVHPDGKAVYVANVVSNSVSVIDTTTRTVVKTVAVGSTPFAFGQFIGPIDSDSDGVPDKLDNCPLIPNPGQEVGASGGSRGSACVGLPPGC